MADAVLEQPPRQRQHTRDRRVFWTQRQALHDARAARKPRQMQPPQRGRLEHASRGAPEAERPAVEPVREGNLEHLAIRSGLPDVAIRRQAVRHDRRPHERRAVVHRLQVDERADAAVDAVAAGLQRGHGIAADAVTPGAKRRRPTAERFFQRQRQPPQFGRLQVGRQVLQHRVARNERLGERRRIPGVQMCGDFPAAAVAHLPQHVRSPRILRHGVRREVGGPHAETVEERGLRP